MKSWFWVCNIKNTPGLWDLWQRYDVTAIGWGRVVQVREGNPLPRRLTGSGR